MNEEIFLNKISELINEVKVILNGLDKKFDKIDKKFDIIDEKFSHTDEKINRDHDRAGEIMAKIGIIEQCLTYGEDRMCAQEDKIEICKKEHSSIIENKIAMAVGNLKNWIIGGVAVILVMVISFVVVNFFIKPVQKHIQEPPSKVGLKNN